MTGPAGSPFSAEVPELLVRHFAALHEGSGIAVDVIRERQARSVLGSNDLKELGFSPAQRRAPGLLLPVHPPDGSVGPTCFRPDIPRVDSRNHDLKYELPAGAGVRLDALPRCIPMLADPSIPLWLTEGQKKG
jgi:hypothetical protein